MSVSKDKKRGTWLYHGYYRDATNARRQNEMQKRQSVPSWRHLSRFALPLPWTSWFFDITKNTRSWESKRRPLYQMKAIIAITSRKVLEEFSFQSLPLRLSHSSCPALQSVNKKTALPILLQRSTKQRKCCLNT